MLYTGIITKEGKKIELKIDKILEYIKNYIEENPEIEKEYEQFSNYQMAINDFNYYEFAVRILEWTIFDKSEVYYPDNSNNFDKIECLKNGWKLTKMDRFVFNGKRYTRYMSPIQKKINEIGAKHSESPENEVSFWYPKTANIGFTTPETLITPLTGEEFKVIKAAEFDKFDYLTFLKRIRDNAINQKFDLDRDLFLRFGCSSNKFNFNACHVPNIEYIPERLRDYFENIYEKLEWRKSAEVVLREFIKTSYYRRQIYNGMPLNTEFRIFYDFDTNELLGIYNYWDTETMVDNLHKRDDAMAFAHTFPLLESDFNRLAPYLEDEAKKKLPNADLQGKWSIDFMYDGKDFVLIDMGHAEASYYYERVLEKQLALQNK